MGSHGLAAFFLFAPLFPISATTKFQTQSRNRPFQQMGVSDIPRLSLLAAAKRSKPVQKPEGPTMWLIFMVNVDKYTIHGTSMGNVFISGN